jgi:type IV pilus assembly protein PilY1
VREQALMENRLAELTGRNPPDVIGPLTPTGEEGNWSDEMAKYMANADVNASLDGVQNVFTYVVEIDPGTTGRGPGTTALMKSTATHGKGKYFGVTSDASGSAIVDALNAIFSEIQAVNSVFAATTLPVSVNVRGTNLNQVYIGVFRPDANKSPRWLGNLKLYELALDSTTNTVFLADAEGNAAEDPLTGFIRSTATSFWTTNSGPFWSFLDPEQNNNNPTDIPDGNLVEKGGAAQQTRIAFANAEGSSPSRKVYTCTDGGTFTAQCTPGSGGNPGSSLSATPFADNNTDISGGLLALETRLVSPLTAFQIKPVTTLTDRRTATLTNAADPIAVTSLDNGATTRTVTNLSTATPKVVSSLTGLTSGEQTVGVSTIARVTGNTYRVQTAVTTLPGGYVIGATVAISGVSGNTSFNGSFSIAAVGTNTFDFSCPGCGATSGTGGTATVSAISQSTIATATLPDHGFTSGQQVTITGASPSQFNGTFGITVLDVSPGVPDPDRFTYIMSSAAGDATVAEGFAAITAAGNTTTATATTSVAHGFLAGTSVTITGASPNEYNGTFTIVSVPSTTSFTYNLATAIGPNTASPVHAHQGGGTTVTVTAPGHLFTDGTGVTIANSDIAGYNGTFPIFNVAGDTFQFTTATVLPANNSTTVTASTGTLPIVTATVNNHGFNVGDSVVIESTSSPADPNHPGTVKMV